MPPSLTIDEMKATVRAHFEDFVNNRKAEVIRTNMTRDFYDHDGPGVFHDNAFVPMAHYLLRLSVVDAQHLVQVIEAITPRIDELVETYTEANVPAER